MSCFSLLLCDSAGEARCQTALINNAKPLADTRSASTDPGDIECFAFCFFFNSLMKKREKKASIYITIQHHLRQYVSVFHFILYC